MYTRYIYIYIITSLTKIIYRCKITLRVFIVGANVLCTGYPPPFHHPCLRSRGTVGQFSVLAMFRVTDPLLISTPDPPPSTAPHHLPFLFLTLDRKIKINNYTTPTDAGRQRRLPKSLNGSTTLTCFPPLRPSTYEQLYNVILVRGQTIQLFGCWHHQ